MKTIQHLSAVAVLTIVIGLIYASVQQSYRSNANDPQTQIVHRLKDRLQTGRSVDGSFSDSIDLETDLGVFTALYDANGNPLRSSGYLHGKMPQFPQGVFDHARRNGEDWVTWEPQPNVRMAMGIVSVHSPLAAFAAVGRSLREVEERVSELGSLLLIGWILCVCLILINWLIHYYGNKNKNAGAFVAAS